MGPNHLTTLTWTAARWQLITHDGTYVELRTVREAHHFALALASAGQAATARAAANTVDPLTDKHQPVVSGPNGKCDKCGEYADNPYAHIQAA